MWYRAKDGRGPVDGQHHFSKREDVALIERTLRGALGVTDVTLSATPGALAASSGPRHGHSHDTSVTVRRTHDDGTLTDLIVRRDQHPFSAGERDLVLGLVEALDRQATGPQQVVSAPPPPPDPDALSDVLERVLFDLDEMVDATIQDRLALVGHRVAQRLDAAGWWLGQRTIDGAVVRVDSSSRRFGTEHVAVTAALDAAEVPGDEPSLVGVLEGGSRVAWIGDGTSDAYLLASHGGFTTAATAGGYDLDARQWLLIVVGDETSPDLRAARAVVSATVQAAMGFPRPPRLR